MSNLEELSGLELTWDQYQEVFLPQFADSQISYVIYQGGKLSEVSSRFRQEFGYPEANPDQIHASLWRDPEERQRFEQMVQQALAGKKVENEIFTVYNGQGEEVAVKIQVGRIPIKDREPICGCFFLRTRRSDFAETEAKPGGEDLFRVLAEKSLNGIALINDRLEAIYANPAALVIYGYPSLEEIRKVPMIKTIAPASLRFAVERAKNWLEGRNNSPQVTYKIIRKNGEVRDVEVMTGTVFFQGMRCHLNSIIDITDRLRAEQALKESEQRYRSLVETSPDAIILIDLNGKIIMANDQAVTMTGAAGVADLVGKAALDFIVPEERTRTMEGLKRIASGEKFRGIEYNMVRFDRRTVPVEVSASILPNLSGEQTGFIVIIRDVSERKRIEQERQKLENHLHQAQKMEAIGQLAGGVAHDFNNLLTVIVSNGEALKMEPADQAEVTELAGEILTAGKRAADLIAKLLAYSRKGIYQEVPVDLHQKIAEAASILSRTIDKRITIKQDLRAARSIIRGDPSRLQSVILNLAINARDAMPEGGELTFSSEVVSVGEDYFKNRPYQLKSGDYLQLRVSDTGIGMDEDVRGHIFEPYFTTKAADKGTGLGLASVYGSVKAHQGAIEVQSTPGRGTTFTILLPLAGSAEPRLPVGNGRDLSLAEKLKHILVVDDEDLVLKNICRTLTSLGYEVSAFRNGEEAIQYYVSFHAAIDLVILDMIMPKPNGKDLFLEMKKINPSVKVLLISGYSVTHEARAMLDLGLRGMLPKPFSREQMAEAIRAAIK